MSTTKSKSATSDGTLKKAPLPNTPSSRSSVTKLSKSVTKSDSETPVKGPNTRLSGEYKASPRSINSKPSVDSAKTPTSGNLKPASDGKRGASANLKPALDSGRPASGHSKSALSDRRASRLSTPPEAPSKRAPKVLDVQAQLVSLQDELKKAKEQLAVVEKEKTEVADELKQEQKLVEETNEKLNDALACQKQAEESSESEKFRATEIEQAGIQASRKKEEEWISEMEVMKIQHSSDIDALQSATQELLRVKKELSEILEDKNQAVSQADAAIKDLQAYVEKVNILNNELDDMRSQNALNTEALQSATQQLSHVNEELSEILDAKNKATSQADAAGKEVQAYAEKVELLMAEVTSLKALLDSKIQAEADDGNVELGLKSEIESLKLELERARCSEEKQEATIERLKGEQADLIMAQAYSNNLVKEWKQQVEELEHKVEEANNKERTASELLSSVAKQLEETQSLLQESEQRTATLTESIKDTEAAVEELQAELEASKEAEAKTQNLVEEWKQKVKKLEKQVEEANSTEKSALDSLSAVKMQLEETRGSLREANTKVSNLKEKVAESGAALEQLNVQLEASRMAEAYANNLLNEWKQKVDELENKVEEANSSEGVAKEALKSVTKELETAQASLQESEAQINVLEEKVGLLEMSFERQRGDHRQAENRAATAEADAFEMAKMVESLKIQLDTVNEEKLQALDNEKLAASNVQSLLEEKNKLINDLEICKYEEEKSKKAMESLAAALHEVSAEAREAKENFLSRQAEHETYEGQIEDLKSVLKETNEQYKTMLDDARHEVDALMSTIDKSKQQFEESKAEWEQSKSRLLSSVKQSDEEKSALQTEMKRLEDQLKEYKEAGSSAESEKAKLIESLKEAESEVTYLQGVLGEAKAESMKLKESLLENESELKDVSQENEELRTREAAALEKVDELSKLLEAAAAKKDSEENGAVVDSKKENGFHSKSVLSAEADEYDSGEEEKHNHLAETEAVLTGSKLFQNMNGDLTKDEKEPQQDEPAEIDEKDYSLRKELEESLDEDVDIGERSFHKRNESGSSEVLENNGTSPSRQKKKKPMLGKFGSLLKKKSSKSQK